MLKLTDWRDRGEIYIAPAHIVGIESTSKGSRVIVPGAMFTVCEKPSEIMAMPEMVNHLNPMYQVPQTLPRFPEFEPQVDLSSLGDFAAKVVLSVRGDCGQVHTTVEGWQNCPTCSHILAHRRA